MNLHTNPPSRSLYEGKHHFRMKTPPPLLFSLLASFFLAGAPAGAQSPAAPPKQAKTENAPNVKNFRSLQKLNQQIVALSKRAQPATVCLIAKNGRGSGSGIVVSEDGLILTAAHVTSSMPGEIIVIFPDGTRKSGVALGADYDRDAAMVKINEPGKYPFVEVGQSKDLKRNEWTVALGHSGGFDPMRKPPVRLGRVLANQDFIVSDTAVIGGDSGGPLFDAEGKVIGIHSNIGMTLMENRHVPIEVFHKQWDKLKNGKTSGQRFNNAKKNAPVPSPDQPVLGIQLADGENGVLVGEVVPKSPAQKAGIQSGDLIKKVNGKVVKSPEELVNLVKGMKAGDEVNINYHREGKARSAKVTLTSYRALMEGEKAPAKKNEQPTPKKEEKPKKEAPKEGESENKKDEAKVSIEELLKNAAKNGGRLELTPEKLEKLGGMENLMKELQKRGGMGQVLPLGTDKFFASSLKALQPVAKKNSGTTALVTIDGKPAVLGTIISENGRILTKNSETDGGKLGVMIGGKSYEAKLLKRFPHRDLALLKIDAEKLRPVRFQVKEPALGSILTATGAKDEPLGIGLLSVSGRAMAKVGFIGIQAGESDKGVLIEKIVPGGAAADAGLKDQDVITRFDGQKVDEPVAFGHLIRGRKAGETIKLEYLRNDKPGKATVTLKERVMLDNVKNDPRMKHALGQLSEKTSGYPDAIQHDIPLPPQLCGGPLFNLKGKCIGINVSRAGRTKTYAIPADEIMGMLEIKAAAKPAGRVAKKQDDLTKAKPAAPSKKNETLEAIKAIRASLRQIEKRLDGLEKAER